MISGRKKKEFTCGFLTLFFLLIFLGLSGTDIPLLWLLQGGQNTLSKDDLQFAAGLPAGHYRLPVPQSHLDCKKVQKGQKKTFH